MGKDSKRLQWFITWPRTDYSKDNFLSDWNNKFKPDEIYVSQENHSEEKEGLPLTHLHCVIKLNFQRAVNKKTILDFCKVQYGEFEAQRIDVKGIRNWKYDKDKVLSYITKEDNSPVMTTNEVKIESDTDAIILPLLMWEQQERKELLEFHYLELEFKHVRERYTLCCDPRTKSACGSCFKVLHLLSTLRHNPFNYSECNLENMELKYLQYLRSLGY